MNMVNLLGVWNLLKVCVWKKVSVGLRSVIEHLTIVRKNGHVKLVLGDRRFDMLKVALPFIRLYRVHFTRNIFLNIWIYCDIAWIIINIAFNFNFFLRIRLLDFWCIEYLLLLRWVYTFINLFVLVSLKMDLIFICLIHFINIEIYILIIEIGATICKIIYWLSS